MARWEVRGCSSAAGAHHSSVEAGEVAEAGALLPTENTKFSLKRKYQNHYRQVLNSCKIYILHGAEVGSVPGFYPHFVPLLFFPNIKREKLLQHC